MPSERGGDMAIQLGLCTYLPDTGQLFDAEGNEARLRPKSMLVLGVLCGRLGQVVSKNDIIAHAWEHAVVSDENITQCIADIRKAIGDTARNILKTVSKRGYVLDATGTKPPEPPAVDLLHVTRDLKLNLVPVLAVTVRVGDDATALPDQGRSDIVACIDLPSPNPSERRLIFRCVDAVSAVNLALDLQAEGRGAGAVQASSVLDMCIEASLAAAPPNSDVTLYFDRMFRHVTLGQSIATAEIRDAVVDGSDAQFEDLGDHAIGRDTKRLYQVRQLGATGALPRGRHARLLPTIAIIPFSGPRDDPSAMVGEALADDIITVLSRSQQVNVISRLSTRQFRQRDLTSAQLSSRLDADLILTGSFMTMGDEIILKLELSDTRSDIVLWADRITAPLRAILTDLDTAHSIVAQLRKAMVLHEIRRVRSFPIATLENYSLLLGAVGLMHRLSQNDFGKARVLLEALMDRVPNQPDPLAWMSRWHVLRVQQGWSEDPHEDARLGLEHTKAALDIDAENTLALVSEGFVLTNLLRQLDDAEDRYNQALQINPNDANARLLRGTLYAFQGKGTEAQTDAEQALFLAPFDPHRFFFLALAASASVAAEDYDRALALSTASLRLNQSHTSTLRVKIIAQMNLGQTGDARKTAQKLIELQPGLRVSSWLAASPGADFEIGKRIAATLSEAGIPD
ncbi:MAG: winged helix-turn-helix domain-containing protein [Pseudomonadota bacterium]